MAWLAAEDMNLYRYGFNGPTNGTDPSGQDWIDDAVFSGAVIGGVVGLGCGLIRAACEWGRKGGDPLSAERLGYIIEGTAIGATSGAVFAPFFIVGGVLAQAAAGLSLVSAAGSVLAAKTPPGLCTAIACTVVGAAITIAIPFFGSNCFVTGTQVIMAGPPIPDDLAASANWPDGWRPWMAVVCLIAGVAGWRLLHQLGRRDEPDEETMSRDLVFTRWPEGDEPEDAPVPLGPPLYEALRDVVFAAWPKVIDGMVGEAHAEEQPTVVAEPLVSLSKLSEEEAPRPAVKPRRRWLAMGWLTACLALAAGLLGVSVSPQPTPTTCPTKAIETIHVGERVVANNPELTAQEHAQADPDPATWRHVKLHAKADGVGYDIELLRPLSWVDEEQLVVGGRTSLTISELGDDLEAEVLAIGSCPSIQSGPGRVVTGTFTHEALRGLVRVQVEGLKDPIECTAAHPFWSVDRQQFVAAGQLKAGERLRDVGGKDSRVTFVSGLEGPRRVFNLEVDGEHVYYVSVAGVLVHNSSPGQTGGSNTQRPVPPGHRRVYRIVENGELADLQRTQGFGFPADGSGSTPNGRPGKFFYSTRAEAADSAHHWSTPDAHGRRGGPYTLVEADIPTVLSQSVSALEGVMSLTILQTIRSARTCFLANSIRRTILRGCPSRACLGFSRESSGQYSDSATILRPSRMQ